MAARRRLYGPITANSGSTEIVGFQADVVGFELPKRAAATTWSGRFDPAWYLLRYPDVALSGLDPLRHFLDHGLREGRKPTPDDAAARSRAVPVTNVAVRCLKKPTLQNEVALFATHSPRGKLKPHVRHYLAGLRRHGIPAVLIVNADRPFSDPDGELVRTLNGCYVRDNRGYDFAAWAQIFRLHPELFEAKTLYLLNDSVFGPTNDLAFANLLARLRGSSADFVGLTECFERSWHIQSYFLTINSRALSSKTFKQFISRIVSYADKEDVIDRFEVTLAPTLRAAGLNCDVLFPAIDAGNPTIAHWERLLRSGFPFLKVMTVRDVFPGADTSDWRGVLAEQGYDVSLAERTVSEEAQLATAALRPPPKAQVFVAAKQVSESQDDPSISLFIDAPEIVNGKAATVIQGRLGIRGWGWARDGVAGIHVSIDGQEFGVANYGIRRDDVGRTLPGWPDSSLSGFAIEIGREIATGEHQIRVELRTKTGRMKAVSFEMRFISELSPVEVLRRKAPRSEIDFYENILSKQGRRPFFGILIGIEEEKDHAAIITTLESLREQFYADWQVTIAAVDAAIPGWFRAKIVDEFPDLRDRVRFVAGEKAVDFAKALTGEGKRRCPDLIGILSPGDVLACDALLHLAIESVIHRDAEFIYSDERRVSSITGKAEVFFKPQWSPDLLLSTNYIGRFWCATADLLVRIGARLSEWSDFGEYDLVLRCTEAASNIRHIPRLLCGRGRPQIDDRSRERAALSRMMARRGIDGHLQEGCAPGYYRLRRQIRKRKRVSVIIPTTGKVDLLSACLAGLLHGTDYPDLEIILVYNNPDPRGETLLYSRMLARDLRVRIMGAHGPFNYSRICNLGAAAATGEYLLFLNDDIEVIEPGWLDALAQHAERPEVGIVGARLLYPDGRVQHGGMFWPAGARAGRHSFRFAANIDPGYFGLAMTTRNVLMVTGACTMVRRELFQELGGYDERHAVVNNDVDLCLRCRSAGRRVVYEPAATLFHHESASRSQIAEDYDTDYFWAKWGKLLSAGDPYYHPHLTFDGDHYSINTEPVQLFHSGHPLFRVEDIRRILAVKLDHIGDFITCVPAINKLRSHFPGADLYLLGSPTNRSLVHMVPEIKGFIDFEFFYPRSELAKRHKLSDEDLSTLERRLAPYRFDLAIDLREQFETRMILRYTGARWLAGYDHRSQFPWLDISVEQEDDDRLINKRSQIGDEISRLVDAVVLTTDPERTVLRLPNGWSPMFPVAPDGRRIACIHPGVGDPTRQWPAKHFATLIDLLVSNHNLEVIVIGGADEIQIAQEVLERVKHKEAVRSLIGRVRLADVPAVLASAVLFVGNNSGPNHIAAGLGVPTIGIYSGVVDARQWGAIGPNAVAVQRQMSCSPCYIATVKDCPRKMACVRELDPSAIYELCRRMLEPNLDREHRRDVGTQARSQPDGGIA